MKLDEPVASTRYLVPVSYIVRIAVWDEYRIAEKRRIGDLGIFPASHPVPATAMAISQVKEIVADLQLRDGPTRLLYDNYVREVTNRFDQALSRLKAEHNFEYGTEFEVAICKTLRMVLPQKYGICRGYVVSAFGEKAGDDIIIYDRMRFPTLRALESDDFSCKEQVPIEAVYAYIEAKHSICLIGNGGSSLQKALTQVGQVKMLCDRRPGIPIGDDRSQKGPYVRGWPEILNPAYGVILSRHVRLKEGDPICTDSGEIERQLINMQMQTLLAPDLCVLGGSNVLIPTITGPEPDRIMTPSPFFLRRESSLSSRIVDGLGFGAGLSFLLWALDWIQLGDMPWPAILNDCMPPKAGE